MSAPAEGRRGVALLVVVVVAAVVGVGVLALWRGAAASRRTDALAQAAASAGQYADSALVVALQAVDAGVWRGLAPGASVSVGTGADGRGAWRALVGRTGWGSVMARGVVVGRSGVRSVQARADRRVVVPLDGPMAMPRAALTGARPWLLDATAVVEVPSAAGAEVRCRDGLVPVAQASSAFPDSVLASAGLVSLDPDTVSGALRGAFRFGGGRLGRPLRIEGMVVLDTDLVVAADLSLEGVLVVRGAVAGAGGRLEVTGAVVSGEANGGQSALGPSDRVRYDACAIRRAVEWVMWPGGMRRRTSFRLF